MTQAPTLQPIDYIVTVVVLAVPMVIGIVYAVRDKKRMTRLEYLFGGKQMALIPVTLSMFVTFQSAITLIGLPTEVYRYGTGAFYLDVGLIICFLSLPFTFVPLMYPLEVTSIYGYLELRFQSRAVRMLSTAIGCIQTIFYLAITLFTPALALQSAAGIPMWMSILVVGGIGTIYTVIGGIKSVIWTDVFQTAIVFLGIVLIITKGSIAVDGVSAAWSKAGDGGRIKFDQLTPDPRIRMTVEGAIIGGIFSWLTTAYNQATLQRIRSLKTLRDAKMVYFINVPLQLLYSIVLVNVGIIAYAYFSHTRCDPYEAGLVNNANQIIPHFVLHTLNDLPGMAGLYMATLFCGALSTLSSGVNALAANTVEDFLERPLKNVSERTATFVTKMAAAVHGVLICLLGYGAQYLDGPVIQMSYSVFGALGTPVLGMFLMGGMVPWANKYGAIAGSTVSLAFNLWVSIGNQFHGRKYPSLPPAPIDSCTNITLGTPLDDNHNKSSLLIHPAINKTSHMTSDPDAYGFFFYDMSYEWYSVFGTLICILVGLAVSFCTKDRNWRKSYFKTNLLLPFCRGFWALESDYDHQDEPENVPLDSNQNI